MQSGTILGERYRIEREIGRGSFGVVYLADDLVSGELRAIKVLLPWAADNESLRHRLRREAKLASHLSGQHIVRIYDCEETADGVVFLVMEYLQGRELDLELRDLGTLPAERVQRLATQILAALGEAHALGVIHRDLKPNNVFLCSGRDAGDFIKVFDFGIAKVSGTGNLMETAKLTLQGGVMGTPVYMSPEQCRGEVLTPASDFYSLGILLYELLAGRVPFDHENPVQILLMHNNRPVPALPPELAESHLGRTIMRALEKDPRHRFASAAEFSESLAGRAVPKPASPTPLNPKRLVQDTPVVAPESVDPRDVSDSPSVKPSMRLIGTVVAAVCLLALAVGYALVRWLGGV